MVDAPGVSEKEYWRSAQQWVDCQDLLDSLLQPVLDRLMQEAALSHGQAILDIGCGTGASTMRAAQAVGPAGHVTGADISGIMLELARRRTDAAGLENVHYCEADAQGHAFDPARFDSVISRFGVMFFDTPVAAFRNIARAVKPGGQMVFLCWANLAVNPWFAVPRAAAIEVLGTPPPSDPRAPGPMAFEDKAYVADILVQAGWHDIRVDEIALELTPKGSLNDVADFATNLGPASRIIKDAAGSAADVAEIETRVAAGLAAFDNGQGLRVPARLNLVKARV